MSASELILLEMRVEALEAEVARLKQHSGAYAEQMQGQYNAKENYPEEGQPQSGKEGDKETRAVNPRPINFPSAGSIK